MKNVFQATTVLAKSGVVYFLLTIAGVAFSLLNFWIISRMAPFAQSLTAVTTEVSAMDLRLDLLERSMEEEPDLLERFVIVEEQTKELNRNLLRIEASQLRLEQKIDSLSHGSNK